MDLRRQLNRAARVASKAAFTVRDRWGARPTGPRLLIYHQVGAGLGRQMEVTVPAFGRQVEWLSRYASVLTLGDALEAAPETDPGVPPAVVITFDDGYRDLYTTAFPRLVEAGLPFTLYLTTGPIETGVPLVPDMAAAPLTWDQVGEMVSSGLVTLGAHTHSHPDLRSLDGDAVRSELETSDDLIRRRTGITPLHFAYPWGYWGPAADVEVRRRYVTATVGSNPARTPDVDSHTLHRTAIQLDDPMWAFREKVRSGLPSEERLRRRLSRYQGP